MSESLKLRTLLRYAFFGVPLGFIGLPLYVHLPKYYADTLPLSLAAIGTAMFVTRLMDCFLDPFIGYASDRYPHMRRVLMIAAAFVIAGGVYGLFALPRFAEGGTVIPMLVILLVSTYLAYSVLTINFYASGLTLSRDYHQNTRISAYRESAIVVGVLVASALPPILAARVGELEAYRLFANTFVVVLIVAALISLPKNAPASSAPKTVESPWAELKRNPSLRWIFALFFINAIPPSITATLFLFFAQDILHAAAWSGGFLAAYFVSAVVSMSLWAKLSKRIGKRRCLMLSMSLAVLSFVWAYMLGENAVYAFLAICILSGAALGGDLALLPSLLADALGTEERSGGLEFGIWNFISKFTLALAAGLALPLLDWLGYVPGVTTANTHALSFTYALVPCMFKLGALALLCASPLDKQRKTV